MSSRLTVRGGGSATNDPLNLGYITSITALDTFTDVPAGSYATYVGATTTVGTPPVTLSDGDTILANTNISGTPATFDSLDFTISPANQQSFKGFITLLSGVDSFFTGWSINDYGIVIEDVVISFDATPSIHARKGDRIICTVAQSGIPTQADFDANFIHIYKKNINIDADSTADTLAYAYAGQVFTAIEDCEILGTQITCNDKIYIQERLAEVPTDFTKLQHEMAGGQVPEIIEENQRFVVKKNRQSQVYGMIENNGFIVLDGTLVQL